MLRQCATWEFRPCERTVVAFALVASAPRSLAPRPPFWRGTRWTLPCALRHHVHMCNPLGGCPRAPPSATALNGLFFISLAPLHRAKTCLGTWELMPGASRTSAPPLVARLPARSVQRRVRQVLVPSGERHPWRCEEDEGLNRELSLSANADQNLQN